MKDDNEILDILSESFKKESENTELPEALSKDNIVAMLKAQQAKDQSGSDAEEKRSSITVSENKESNKGIKKFSKKYMGYIAAAAAFVIIAGAGVSAMNSRRNAVKTDTEASAASETTAMAETETVIEAVTEEVTDEDGSIVATEVATDNSGRILTTIINILNELGNAAKNNVTVKSTGSPSATESETEEILLGESPATTVKSYAGVTGSDSNTADGSSEQSLAGYRYSQDGYYYCDDSEAGGLSYDTIRSKWSDTAGLYLDEVSVRFKYDNKGWLIQLAKGQYGYLFLGSEIGVYTCSESDYNSNPGNLSNYSAAASSDMMKMSITMYYRGKDETGAYKTAFITSPADHCWCNGFVQGQLKKFSAPRTEIKTLSRITFKSSEMAELFTAGLDSLGFGKSDSASSIGDDTYYCSGSYVYVLCYEIHNGTVDGSMS